MTDLIDVPALGERIVYTWPAEVAARLNRTYFLEVLTHVSTNNAPASATTVTGMTFPVENTESYRIEGYLDYTCSATNQGIAFGFRHPGGLAHGLFQATGPTDHDTLDNNRLFENTANTDILTGFANVSAAASHYFLRFAVFYHCTADGTFSFRWARNGTSGSTGVTLYKSSGAVVYMTSS